MCLCVTEGQKIERAATHKVNRKRIYDRFIRNFQKEEKQERDSVIEIRRGRRRRRAERLTIVTNSLYTTVSGLKQALL